MKVMLRYQWSNPTIIAPQGFEISEQGTKSFSDELSIYYSDKSSIEILKCFDIF